MKNRCPAFLLVALLPFASACSTGSEHGASSKPGEPGRPADPQAQGPATQPTPGTTEEPGPGRPRSVTYKGTGHLTVTGDYTIDADISVSCFMAIKALEVQLIAPKKQRVVLHVPDLAPGTGSAKYKSEIRMIAPDISEAGFRQSEGTVEVEIKLEPTLATLAPKPRGERRQASATFEANYSGEAGKGTIKASFKECVFEVGTPGADDQP